MWDLNYLNVKSILVGGGGGPNIFWRGQLLSFKNPTNILDHIIEIFWTFGEQWPPTQQHASAPGNTEQKHKQAPHYFMSPLMIIYCVWKVVFNF